MDQAECKDPQQRPAAAANNAQSPPTTKVRLPNPHADPIMTRILSINSMFGRRVSQWARPEADRRVSRKSKEDENDENDENDDEQWVTFENDRMLRVSLGFWNSIAQPRHMELSFRIDDPEPTDAANNDTVEAEFPPTKEAILSVEKMEIKSKLWRKDKPMRHKKPLWHVDAFMGGDNTVVFLPGRKVQSPCNLENRKSNAGLALDRDVSERGWAMKGAIIHKHWIEIYHMKASTFASLLRRFVRWGFAVGVGRQFRFHPLFFAKNSLQKNRKKDPEHHNFINCQASIAMLSSWWIREAAQEILQPSRRTSLIAVRSHVEECRAKVVDAVAPHILMRPTKVLFLWWMPKVQRDARECLTSFITSDAVQDALGWDDGRVTEVIVQYEKDKAKVMAKVKEEKVGAAVN